MAKSVSARDQQIASTNTTLSQATAGVREQVISVTDLISEGPIYGLVDSEASIFLNDDRIVSANAASTPASRELSVSLTNASTTATLSNTVYGIGDTTRRLMTVTKAVEATSTGVSLIESSVSAGTTAISLSTAAAFFDNTWMLNPAITGFVNLVLYENNREVNRLVGTFSAISSTTSAEFTASTSNNVILDTFIEEAATKTLQIEVSAMSWITINSGTVNATLDNPWLLSTGTYTVTLSSYALSGVNISSEVFRNYSRFEGVTAQFRTGHLNQSPMVDFLGVSNTQIPQGTSFSPYPLEYIDSLSENPSDTPAAPAYITSGASGFGLTAQQAQEVDEVRLNFTYGSMQVSKSTSGTTGQAHAIYKIELILNRGLDTSTVVLVPQRLHSAESTTAISFEEVINLEPFKPFTDFAVRVTRLTRHDGRGIRADASNKKSEWSMQAASSITSVTSVIKENLTYPYTAYANVTFSSKEFNNVPTRTYHARGLKVQVPSNYTTREESLANGGGIAVSDLYTGLWDGSFREDKVYTNNPAWIFYDILTNNRYGLGDWIRATDIDKYTLYRVGRYCDELVSDGKGGLEPRFTSNIYLTKAADAYKVLKDMASSFLSMLYWIDGQITTVVDQPKDAVYTFSKGNVIDGTFNYESTGSKTRPNQILVNWNNPESDYNQEILIVEDKENIVKTGRIITEDAVAFGCTSQAQAQRYGRWKLWTAANQTEVVSFKTSVNAAFLMPGDIVKIQDADRYAIQYSGRISSGILNTTTIPLDRQITLNAGSTYYLSVLIEGDNTEVGDSTEPTETTVETLEVTTAAGIVSSLTVATGFSLIPPAGSIWVLREVTAEGTVRSSAKDYKILAISEDSKQEYSITAVEHYNEKFTAVEEDFTLVQDEPVVSSTEVVPAPKNVYVLRHPDPTKEGNEFSIAWDVPQKNGSPYTKISGYEIVHNIPGYDSPYKLFGSVNKMTFVGVEEGSYSISVRTINTIENRSNFTTTVFNLEDPFPLKVPRAPEGLGFGGSANSGLRLSDTYVLNFEINSPAVISPIVAPEDTFSGNVTGVNTISGNLSDGVYTVLFDNSTSALLATGYNSNPSHGVPYYFDAIVANGNPESTFNSLSGTVSVLENSIFVTGSGTSFTTDFALGDIIRFNSLQAAKIVTIINDTNLLIDRSFSSAISGSTYAVNGLRLEFEKDILVAKFTKSGSTSILKSFMGIDTTLTGPQGEVGERGPGRWHIPVTALPTTSAEADAAWISGAGNQPAIPIADDQAWFFTGTLTNPTAQSVWIYNGSSWDEQVEVIDGSLLVNGTVTADAIASNTITASEIAANTITAAEIAANTITASEIAANTITASEIAANTITASEIASETITATELAADSVTAAKIDVVDIAAINADLGAITAGSLQGGTVPDANAAPSGAETGSFFDLDNGKFVVGNATNNILFDGTNLSITGNISATTGTIGGFTVGSEDLTAGTGASHISLSTAEGIHLGDDAFASAPFSVSLAGALTATGATISGDITADSLDISSATISGSLTADNISVTDLASLSADLGSITAGSIDIGSGTFTVDSLGNLTANNADIVGDITATSLRLSEGIDIFGQEIQLYSSLVFFPDELASGTGNIGEISIDPGKIKYGTITREISTKVDMVTPFEGGYTAAEGFYIIWGASPAWGTATDVTNGDARFATSDSSTLSYLSASDEGIFVAIYDSATSQWKAIDNGGATVDFTLLATDIKIAYGTKTSTTGGIDTLDRLGVFTNDPFSLDTTQSLIAGTTITDGGITMSAGGSVKGGQTAYATGDGFFLGYDTNAYKFSIGNATNYLTWDGTDLTVTGNISADTLTFDGASVTGTLAAANIDVSGVITAGGILTDSVTISNNIKIGSGESVFIADSNGIYLGNETFASAEFSVTPEGALNATSATITGDITATNLDVTNANISGTITAPNLIASNNGRALNFDPLVKDSTAWVAATSEVLEGGTYSDEATFTTVANGKVGKNVLRSPTGANYTTGAVYTTEFIPVGEDRDYVFSLLARESATAPGGDTYFGVAFYSDDAAGGYLDTYYVNDLVPGTNAGVNLTSAFGKYELRFGVNNEVANEEAGDITTLYQTAPAGTLFAKLVVFLNVGDTASTTTYVETQDIRIEETLPVEAARFKYTNTSTDDFTLLPIEYTISHVDKNIGYSGHRGQKTTIKAIDNSVAFDANLFVINTETETVVSDNYGSVIGNQNYVSVAPKSPASGFNFVNTSFASRNIIAWAGEANATPVGSDGIVGVYSSARLEGLGTATAVGLSSNVSTATELSGYTGAGNLIGVKNIVSRAGGTGLIYGVYTDIDVFEGTASTVYGSYYNVKTAIGTSNSYILYGYSDSVATNSYGIYITSANENYFGGVLNTFGGLEIGGTSVVDSSRNLKNIASVSLNDFSLESRTTTLATTTQTVIAAYPLASYSGGKFIITAKDGINTHICELLVTHNGSSIVATQYGSVFTSTELATYDVNISTFLGEFRIVATSASTNSTVYKVAATLMEA